MEKGVLSHKSNMSLAAAATSTSDGDVDDNSRRLQGVGEWSETVLCVARRGNAGRMGEAEQGRA